MTSNEDDDGIEVYGRFPLPPRRRVWVRVLLTAVAMLMCGAGSRIALNVMEWRASDQRAREVLHDGEYPHDVAVNAIVTLQRGTRCTIGALRYLAAKSGPLQHHACNALLSIERALTEPLADLPAVKPK